MVLVLAFDDSGPTKYNLGKPQKKFFFSGLATKRGGGRARPRRKKDFLKYILAQKLRRIFFLSLYVSGYFKTKKKFLWPLSRGGGGKGLN